MSAVELAPDEFGRTVAFRDPVSFGADLLRLERHYRAEAERLAKEAREARQAAREVRAWRANLRA